MPTVLRRSSLQGPGQSTCGQEKLKSKDHHNRGSKKKQNNLKDLQQVIIQAHHRLCRVALGQATVPTRLAHHTNSTCGLRLIIGQFGGWLVGLLEPPFLPDWSNCECSVPNSHRLAKSYFWQLFVQNEHAPPFPDCQLSTLTTVKPSLITAPSFTYWDWDHFTGIWKHGIGIIMPGLGNILVLAMQLLPPFSIENNALECDLKQII